MKNYKKDFIEKYEGAILEDDSIYNSEDVKTFSREFKRYLKYIVPDCNIVNYSLGHYELSTFIEKNGKYVYLRYSIPRYGKRIHLTDEVYYPDRFDPLMEEVLIRRAKNEEDYKGEGNYFCMVDEIDDYAERLLK